MTLTGGVEKQSGVTNREHNINNSAAPAQKNGLNKNLKR